MIAICTELRKVSSFVFLYIRNPSALFSHSFIFLVSFELNNKHMGFIFQLGATVEEGPDYCVITPPENLNVTTIDTYDDHRMAMAFSLAACGDVPVIINEQNL